MTRRRTVSIQLGVGWERKRREAGRRSRRQREIEAAIGQHEDLAAAVLVEVDRRRVELLRLRGEEVLRRRLAGAGLAGEQA